MSGIDRKKFDQARVNGGSNYDSLRRTAMPTHNRKPSECSTGDCRAAFTSFRTLYRSKHGLSNPDECHLIESGHNVTGGRQYKVAYLKAGVRCYFKPKLHRMWFYSSNESIAVVEDHERFTVSHLCHTDLCCNPRHLVLESLGENKSRNTCSATADSCSHFPKCVRQGPQYEPYAKVYVILDEAVVEKQRS